MDLTTRPPSAVPAAAAAEPPAPVLRELRSIVDELRAFAGTASAGAKLPPLPEAGGAAEPALRWFRAVLSAGGLAPPALRAAVDDAFGRLAARAAPGADPRPLEAARDTALRLIAAAIPPDPAVPAAAGPSTATVEPALVLRALSDQVRLAVTEAIGPGPAYVPAPAAAEDPGNAGAALLGWLRTAAARAGVPLEALGPAVDAGVGRAAELLPAAAIAGDAAAALAGAREVITRGLEAAPFELGRAGGLSVLVAEVERAVGAALGPGATRPTAPAVVADLAASADALAGWLRAVAARAGAPPGLAARAVDEATARALASAQSDGADPAVRAAILGARGLIARALGPAGPQGPSLLYRPDVPARVAAARTARGAVDDGRRVEPIGADERNPGRQAKSGRPTGPEPEPATPGNPTEGPMQCIRQTVDALLSGDAAAFVAQWVYPACFWIDGAWHGCADELALASWQRRWLLARRERGIAAGRILLLRVDPVSETVAHVHVVLDEPHGDPAGSREVEALYTTVRTADGWRAAVAIAG